ncbi:MAG: DNA primase, partial [Methanomassiliicoccales archaeon]
ERPRERFDRRYQERKEAAEPAEEPEDRRPGKKLSSAQEKFKGMINELSATSKARILDMRGGLLKEVAVKELVNTLKEEKEPISAVVFDGIVTQRILDIAGEQKIATIVGTKMGNVTKQPSNVEVWTKEELN